MKGTKAIKQYKGTEVIITNPLLLPDVNHIEEYYEPFVIGKELIKFPISPVGSLTIVTPGNKVVISLTVYFRDDNNPCRVYRSSNIPLHRPTRESPTFKCGGRQNDHDAVHTATF